jgi:hypothetical protein
MRIWLRQWLVILVGLVATGCSDRSTSSPDAACAGMSNATCDVIPPSVSIALGQAAPQFQWMTAQVLEGACSVPVFRGDLWFNGNSLYAAVAASVDAGLEPRCRIQVASAEGLTLDIVLKVASSTSFTWCCTDPRTGKTTPQDFVTYSWSVTVNGVELGINNVVLPPPLDAGIPSADGAGD